MTKENFIRKESEKYYGVKVEGKTFHFDDGLAKGLEIAEGFASWAITEFTKAAIGKDSVFIDDKDINDAELLEIYLTEINEKR